MCLDSFVFGKWICWKTWIDFVGIWWLVRICNMLYVYVWIDAWWTISWLQCNLKVVLGNSYAIFSSLLYFPHIYGCHLQLMQWRKFLFFELLLILKCLMLAFTLWVDFDFEVFNINKVVINWKRKNKWRTRVQGGQCQPPYNN